MLSIWVMWPDDFMTGKTAASCSSATLTSPALDLIRLHLFWLAAQIL